MAQTIYHPAASRAVTDLGWLKSYHSFSFGHYYDPKRMGFGALRVLNDDTVDGGEGFGDHPHDNMEIISIPLKGGLRHQDSMDNVALIMDGDIQVMSAGTGIFHEEHNENADEAVQFLQIWVYPKVLNVTPRYDQLRLSKADRHNQLQQILSPDMDDSGVWIQQDAWFHIGDLSAGFADSYRLHRPGNGVYAFVISGAVEVDGKALHTRDGLGVWDTGSITIKALSDAELLLMEVPMTIS